MTRYYGIMIDSVMPPQSVLDSFDDLGHDRLLVRSGSHIYLD